MDIPKAIKQMEKIIENHKIKTGTLEYYAGYIDGWKDSQRFEKIKKETEKWDKEVK